MLKKYIFSILVLVLALFSISPVIKADSYSSGSLLALLNVPQATVYYIGDDGKKYAFPDAKTYFTWYDNFDDVIRVDITVLDSYPDGGVVPYKAGTKLITHQNTAKVYAVEPNGLLRWIPSEDVAIGLYGTNWYTRVQDVIPGYFSTGYSLGENLSDTLPTGTIVRVRNTNYYYYVANGQKRISTEYQNYHSEDIVEVDNLDNYPDEDNNGDDDASDGNTNTPPGGGGGGGGGGVNATPTPVDNDLDNDGYDSVASGGNDCNDNNVSIHPGASDICGDGIDQDCSGTDLSCSNPVDNDIDNDGYDSVASGGADCNDNNTTIHPNATDICGDGVDQDCSGADLQCQAYGTLLLNLPLDSDYADSTGNNQVSCLPSGSCPTPINDGQRQAYNFNGSTCLDLGTNNLLDLSDNTFTISAWIKPSSVDQVAYIVGKSDTNSVDRKYGMTVDATRNFITYTNNYTRDISTFVAPLNTWSFVAMTWDGSTKKAYANGQLLGSWSGIAITADDLSPLVACRHNGTSQLYHFNGAIDEVNIYDNVLSDSQIGDLYSSQNQGVSPPVDNDIDNDGYDSASSGGTDCNDNSASIHPGATEICGDSIDQDCSGADLQCVVNGQAELLVSEDFEDSSWSDTLDSTWNADNVSMTSAVSMGNVSARMYGGYLGAAFDYSFASHGLPNVQDGDKYYIRYYTYYEPSVDWDNISLTGWKQFRGMPVDGWPLVMIKRGDDNGLPYDHYTDVYLEGTNPSSMGYTQRTPMTPLSHNQWHLHEFYLSYSSTVGGYAWYIDGQLVAGVPYATFDDPTWPRNTGTPVNYVNGFRFAGGNGPATDSVYYVDNIEIWKGWPQ